MNKNQPLVNLLGDSWYHALENYLISGSFSKLGAIVADQRQKTTIYPAREDVFRCFRLTTYVETKVVILGQDPYHDNSADGLAFSNSRVDKISPSLANILKEIDSEFPEDVDDILHGRLDRQDLKRWAGQGVLLLNTALTVAKGKPGSHMKLWEEFTSEVINAVNMKNNIVWILLGKEAQKWSSLITNPTHAVLTAPHPAAEIYSGGTSGFFGSSIFKSANEELDKRNLKPIYW